jgi:hypothetical protein
MQIPMLLARPWALLSGAPPASAPCSAPSTPATTSHPQRALPLAGEARGKGSGFLRAGGCHNAESAGAHSLSSCAPVHSPTCAHVHLFQNPTPPGRATPTLSPPWSRPAMSLAPSPSWAWCTVRPALVSQPPRSHTRLVGSNLPATLWDHGCSTSRPAPPRPPQRTRSATAPAALPPRSAASASSRSPTATPPGADHNRNTCLPAWMPNSPQNQPSRHPPRSALLNVDPDVTQNWVSIDGFSGKVSESPFSH